MVYLLFNSHARSMVQSLGTSDGWPIVVVTLFEVQKLLHTPVL